MTDSVDPQPIRDAATMMVARDSGGGGGIEVLVVRRSSKAAFAPGAIVFPGGAMDARDVELTVHTGGRDVAPAGAHAGGGDGPALWVTAIRETFEEAGVFVGVEDQSVDFDDWASGRAGLIDLASIAFVARWVTPPHQPRRFDTRFFVAAAPADSAAAADMTEVLSAAWENPSDLLMRAKSGEISMLPPTWANISWLAGFACVDDLVSAGLARAVETVRPEMVLRPDGTVDVVFNRV